MTRIKPGALVTGLLGRAGSALAVGSVVTRTVVTRALTRIRAGLPGAGSVGPALAAAGRLMARRALRITSGTLVTGLVTAALITVGSLAVLAAGTAPDPAVVAARTSGKDRAARGAAGAARGPRLTAVPAGSGSGERVVYSIGRRRVWLIDGAERLVRTFPVTGGAVVPDIGAHRVFARRARGAGGDGAVVEHIVLFAQAEGQNVGFSAALDGSLARPDPAKRTAAVREGRLDGAALWRQATLGTTVRVLR